MPLEAQSWLDHGRGPSTVAGGEMGSRRDSAEQPGSPVHGPRDPSHGGSRVRWGNGNAAEMTAEAALAHAHAFEPATPTGIHAGFDGGLEMGQQIMLRQRGRTADPDVFGSLRYLDDTRVSIDHTSPETGAVAVHFPVAGYVVSAA